MSDGNAVLALALGAGGGLALWYLLRDDDKKKPTPTPPATDPGTAAGMGAAPPATAPTPAAPAAPSAPATATPGLCMLRLAADGLTADGQRVEIPTAVARCKAAGRVDLVLTDDAPGAVYLELSQALTKAGLVVPVPRRNGVAPGRSRRRRTQRAAGRNATTYQHFTLRAYPEGRAGNATQRWFRAASPTTWASARDRLIAAGIADAEAGGRTHVPGGWMLSVDPKDYREERAEPLP